jgi:hypothetical protein
MIKSFIIVLHLSHTFAEGEKKQPHKELQNLNPKPIFLEVRPPPPSPSLEAGRGLRRTPTSELECGRDREGTAQHDREQAMGRV